MKKEQVELPIPDVKPGPITVEQFMALTPEKLELVGGYLIDGPKDHAARLKLLVILLTNVGLTEAVRLAPRGRWENALRETYG
ncbi:MAG: hypothetical protein HY347_05735 [candidate division NC10 bacterium]|nr:hypothetical protein [candidate division NC10 bacterium]